MLLPVCLVKADIISLGKNKPAGKEGESREEVVIFFLTHPAVVLSIMLIRCVLLCILLSNPLARLLCAETAEVQGSRGP